MNLVAVASQALAVVPVPDEGQEVTAVAAGPGKGPVRPAYQALANNEATAHEAELNQSLVPRVSLDADGTSTIRVSCPGRIALKTAGGNRYFSTGPVSFPVDPTALRPAAAAWPANSHLYIYALSAAAPNEDLLAVEVWAVAPDAALVFKSDDSSKRYLGCFRTDAAAPALIVPMRAERGRYLLDGWYVAATGKPDPGVDLILDLVPPHVRRALIVAYLPSDAGNTRQLYVRRNGVIAGAPALTVQIDTPAVAGQLIWLEREVTLDATRRINWRVVGAVGADAAIGVRGWTE